MRRAWRLVTAGVVVLVAGAISVGISDRMSRPLVELAALRQAVLPARQWHNTPFRVRQSDPLAPYLISRLQAIGETYVCVSDADFERDPFPEVSIHQVERLGIFKYRVGYSVSFGSLGGEYGEIIVTAFFGRILEVEKIVRLVA